MNWLNDCALELQLCGDGFKPWLRGDWYQVEKEIGRTQGEAHC